MAVLIAQSETSYALRRNVGRKLVRQSDGTLWACYIKQLDAKYQVYVKKSEDGGSSWTGETRISTYAGMNVNDQYSPAMAVDDEDNLHVIWMGWATGYTAYQIWHNKYTDSWGTPVRVSTYSGMQSHSHECGSIAVDGDGNVHVTWHGQATGYTSGSQVWHNKYVTSWTTPDRVSVGTGMNVKVQTFNSITVDADGHLHVVWSGADSTYSIYQVWHNEYTDSWGTPYRVSNYSGMDGKSQNIPVITIDEDGYLHVAWLGRAVSPYDTYTQIWYRKYDGSWGTVTRISDYSGMVGYYQDNPNIAVDVDGNVHVMWDGKATGYTDNNKVWRSIYTDSWGTPTCEQATGLNVFPIIRCSYHFCNGGYFQYVFLEGTGSPYNIYFVEDTNYTMRGAPPPVAGGILVQVI